MPRRLEKIDFFLPLTSQYEVLHHFTRKFYEAFVRAGYTCRILDTPKEMELPKKDPPDLTIGFNGAPRSLQKELYCDFLKIPHLACLVDPPYHFSYLFNSHFVVSSCDDQIGCEFLNMMGLNRHFFLPHAVEPELLEQPLENPDFGVVMLATFIDYEKRRQDWRKKYRLSLCKKMENAVEMVFADPKVSFISAFDQMMESADFKLETIKLNEILKDLECYVKGRDRAELANAVREEPLHIFGASIDEMGWKEYFGGKKRNIKIHPPVEYSQAIKIMKKAKILLNPCIKNKQGAHERVFTGLAAGALVITTESQYLLDRFEEKKELVYYRHPNLESIDEDIATYLSNETKRLELVKQGRNKVLKGETWDQRVKTVAKQLPQILEQIPPI